MKKTALLFFIALGLLFFSQSVNSQNTQEQETKRVFRHLFVEGALPYNMASINYEDRTGRLGLGFRFGVGLIEAEKPDYSGPLWKPETKTVCIIPVGINYLLGDKDFPHCIEMGAGVAFLTEGVILREQKTGKKAGIVIGHFQLMYRYQPLRQNLVFRAGFMPLWGIVTRDIMVGGGISLGYMFH
ncbi:MAG: hypothetical protein LIO93_02380 [Bacteroidales bacterium]|nr:hypothetical protein [Bacteroidales bacterium]